MDIMNNDAAEEYRKFVKFGFKQLSKRELVKAFVKVAILGAIVVLVGQLRVKYIIISSVMVSAAVFFLVLFFLRLGKDDADRFRYTFCTSLYSMLVCLTIALIVDEQMNGKSWLFALIALLVIACGAGSCLIVIKKVIRERRYSDSVHKPVNMVIPLIFGIIGIGTARMLLGMHKGDNTPYIVLVWTLFSLVFVFAFLCTANALKVYYHKRLM